MKMLIATILITLMTVGCQTTGETNLTDDNYQKNVSEMTGLVLFSADWCPACKKFAPVWNQVSEEYADVLDFKRVNTDVAKTSSEKIKFIPTVVVYLKGVPIGVSRARTVEGLKLDIQALLKMKKDLDTKGI